MTVATAIALVTFNLIAESRGIYRPWRSERIGRDIKAAFGTWVFAAAILLLVGFLTKTTSAFPRSVTLGWFICAGVLISVWRIGADVGLRYLRGRGRNTQTVAIVGATEIAEQLSATLAERPWLGMRVVGLYDDRGTRRRRRFTKTSIPFAGSTETLIRDAREGRLDIVYIALPLSAQQRIGEVLEGLADTTSRVCLAGDYVPFGFRSTEWDRIAGIPVLSVYDSPFDFAAGGLKRLEDLILGSLIMLLVAVPMLAIAVAIKATSKGPVFFRQRRFGLNAVEFRVLKFRTMKIAGDEPRPTRSTSQESRLTPVGRFLRRYALDELPQFLQVLTGEMSIVGPRVHAAAHNEAYRSLIRGHMSRHRIKPGIIGWAEVNGFRGDPDTFERIADRFRYDLDYMTNWYLGFDLRIIGQAFLSICRTLFSTRAVH